MERRLNLIKNAIALISNSIIESSESSESSDEDIILFMQKPQREKHNRIENFVNITVAQYSLSDFKSHFRMSKAAVENLCTELEFKSNVTCGRHPIRPLHAVLLTVWTLANQESFRGIGDRFGLQKGNTQTIVINTCKLICKLKTVYIVWPEGDALRRTVSDFDEMRGNNSFPNVVGCVDGTHIAIKGPTNDNSFYNRKGYHSSILQVICNSKYEFIDIYFGWPGSVHDARVWQMSPIYNKLKNEHGLPEEYHLLGDSAYPVDLFLMAPFKDNGHLTRRQKKFNQRLSSSRVVVEQAIGRLKQIFRRLRYLDAILTNLKYYVVSACVLINYAIKHDGLFEIENNNVQDPSNDIEEYEEYGNNRNGVDKRQRILLSIT